MDSSVLQSLQTLRHQAASLLLYQSVLSSASGQAFLHLLDTLVQNHPDKTRVLYAYGAWFKSLAVEQQTWQEHLISQILRADNPFSQMAQRLDVRDLPIRLMVAAQHDLRALRSLYSCSEATLSNWIQLASVLEYPTEVWDRSSKPLFSPSIATLYALPLWTHLETNRDWAELVGELAVHYRDYGAGLFAEYWACRWQTGHLIGIPVPDPVKLGELMGYEAQRDALLKNTEALLAGCPALHVLLYGSRGTGKSSLIKSLLHEYGDRGLRLIEVSKSELHDLPVIVDQLRQAPQKFILFVDDLSFEDDDEAYKALKVVLEGNLTARPQNTVVYATSNRRHLIREFFSDRPRPSDADEIHAWDTVQEKLSFSDRFGLTLTFEPADQETYLRIVHHLAERTGITLAAEELEYRALQWATRHNGRSGRTARQFVDVVRAEQGLFPHPSHRG